MTDKLTAGMKSWIKQDYQDICESPAEYGISDAEKEFGKIVDSLRKMSMPSLRWRFREDLSKITGSPA